MDMFVLQVTKAVKVFHRLYGTQRAKLFTITTTITGINETLTGQLCDIKRLQEVRKYTDHKLQLKQTLFVV